MYQRLNSNTLYVAAILFFRSSLIGRHYHASLIAASRPVVHCGSVEDYFLLILLKSFYFICSLKIINVSTILYHLFLCKGRTGIQNGPIRLLRNGNSSPSYTSGRVQLVYRRLWGNINDCKYNPNINFGLPEATVICHQLGYTGASTYTRASQDSYVHCIRDNTLDTTMHEHEFL